MRIGIIGGTGNMGRGLTLRWVLKHDILMGSRKLEKARRIAKEMNDLAIVSKLVRAIPNLRPLRVGPLENSKWVESITPLLLNAAILNGLHDPSIRIVPWMPTSLEF